MVFSYVLYAISILHDYSLWSPEYRLSAASLRIINYLQPVLLRLQPILALKAVAGFMFLRVLVVGGADGSVAMVWSIDIDVYKKY